MPTRTLDELRTAQESFVQQPGLSLQPARPLAPDNISVQNTEFALRVSWSEVPSADGYNLAIMGDQDLSSPDIIIQKPGRGSLEHVYQTGNVAVTKYFAVQAFKNLGSGGQLVSDWSTIASGTSEDVTQVGVEVTEPGTQTFTNVETTLMTVTRTMTGRSALIIAQSRVFGATGKAFSLRLKEDGSLIKLIDGDSANNIESTVFTLRTPSAASHTYILTGQNNTDATTLSAGNNSLLIQEIPFSTSVEASPAPQNPESPITEPENEPTLPQPTQPEQPPLDGGIGKPWL